MSFSMGSSSGMSGMGNGSSNSPRLLSTSLSTSSSLMGLHPTSMPFYYPTTTGTTSTRPRQTRKEIAKRSRDKQKLAEHQLEQRVLAERERNRQLLIRTTSGLVRRNQEQEVKRAEALKALSEMAKVDSSSAELKAKLMAYREKYSDFGDERGAKVMFHMARLKELLTPTEVSKLFFVLMNHWHGQPEPEAFEGETTVSEIWNTMAKSMGISKEQLDVLKTVKSDILMQDESMRSAFESIDKLEEMWKNKNTGMSDRMDDITSAISPSQAVKFLEWLENNEAVIHMINWQDWKNAV